MSDQKNVLGKPLGVCCSNPMTGFYRDGYCALWPEDMGLHLVCTVVDDAFLTFSKDQGNDLSTPRPEYAFPGLKDGDQWCLCALRWKEALEEGAAPPIILEATHEKVLEIVPMETLLEHRYMGGSHSYA
ncbi:DUF2237 domain-containing protein [Candidatus Marinamargulisbacteria bacterium SCGC AG-439-L15]|nr:DUF2237 domain-containing protein [Candidatus Marinamargulisbacteria bacterium SCGC AG-439-L15]